MTNVKEQTEFWSTDTPTSEDSAGPHPPARTMQGPLNLLLNLFGPPPTHTPTNTPTVHTYTLPSPGLVNTLCNEVCWKRLLKHLLVLEWIVNLTIRHAIGTGRRHVVREARMRPHCPTCHSQTSSQTPLSHA